MIDSFLRQYPSTEVRSLLLGTETFPYVTQDQLRKVISETSPLHILAFDPGDTTGVTYLEVHHDTIHAISGQILGTASLIYDIMTWFARGSANDMRQIVCEDYRVYQSKAASHVNSRVNTTRVIGMIEMMRFICALPPIHYQMASEGKGFFTDAKLKEGYFYVKGKPHGMDALRHALHYLLFHVVTKEPVNG